MTQPFRLAAGGRIDRTRRLCFRFDRRRYEGHPGDTLASALLANGVRLVARSVKYHRPRGILSAGPEEPSALVQLETGDSALAYVLEQSGEVGAVFSDVQMPGDTDGLDLAQYIAVNWPAITVVLTSGRVHPTGDLPSNIKFVSKPWVAADVLAALAATP